MGLREILCDDVNWIYLAQDTDRWRLLLFGLSRNQPISDSFYERLDLSWLPFQCLMCVAFNMYFLYSINDNFN
jgi:hypothetical protein